MISIKTVGFSLVTLLLISATFVSTNLEIKSILDGRVEVKIPVDFEIMSEEMMKFKYPSERRPTLIYTNEAGSTNVAFNLLDSPASQSEIASYKEHFVPYMNEMYANAEWIENGIVEINKREVGFLEFIIPAADTKIYNLMFFTDVEGKLLLCTFNCTIKNMEEWKPVAKEIMNSLVIK